MAYEPVSQKKRAKLKFSEKEHFSWRKSIVFIYHPLWRGRLVCRWTDLKKEYSFFNWNIFAGINRVAVSIVGCFIVEALGRSEGTASPRGIWFREAYWNKTIWIPAPWNNLATMGTSVQVARCFYNYMYMYIPT